MGNDSVLVGGGAVARQGYGAGGIGPPGRQRLHRGPAEVV